eukprot:gene7371-13111_t
MVRLVTSSMVAKLMASEKSLVTKYLKDAGEKQPIRTPACVILCAFILPTRPKYLQTTQYSSSTAYWRFTIKLAFKQRRNIFIAEEQCNGELDMLKLEVQHLLDWWMMKIDKLNACIESLLLEDNAVSMGLSAILNGSQQNIVLFGYWPEIPQLLLTYYSIDLFEQWNTISCQSPGTSLSSFVKSIDCISANAGKGRESLYDNAFIANDAKVAQHMKAVYDKMFDKPGEQYGYALYLHKELMSNFNIQFLWQDIMGKYWPWLEEVSTRVPELSHLLSMSTAQSVVHAKAHSLDCQEGLYQEKAALSTGESMEQFFSCLARCGLTTKNMTAAGI